MLVNINKLLQIEEYIDDYDIWMPKYHKEIKIPILNIIIRKENVDKRWFGINCIKQCINHYNKQNNKIYFNFKNNKFYYKPYLEYIFQDNIIIKEYFNSKKEVRIKIKELQKKYSNLKNKL
jgi:hypothetical protein